MLNFRNEQDFLPAGVILKPMQMHQDHRGWLTEIYRQEWDESYTAIQCNALFSKQHVVRGVHVHERRVDYFVVPHGKAEIGLKDIRKNSPTYNCSVTLCLDANQLQIIIIPPGIIHGFYFLADSILLSGFNQYYDPNDEFGCFWHDPDLNIPWSHSQGILSERDMHSQSYQALIRSFSLK